MAVMIIQGTLFQYTLSALMVVSFTIQSYFYLKFFLKSARWKGNGRHVPHAKPVSVVVCARNEASNLREFLPMVLKQNHPDFEVVVVNDASEDDTDLVLSSLKSQYPNLKISSIAHDPRFYHNKKLARVIGIKAAKNELLLITDADCRPGSDNWLTMMTSPLASGSEITLGHGGFSRSPGFLNLYIRYDAMFEALKYTGMALCGIPYKGIGRNLAYRKELFMKGNGFASHYHIPSGDDDLFVNANANSGNTAVELSPGSHTRAVPANSISEFIRQKRSSIITLPLYRFTDRARLLVEPLSRSVFYLSSIILLSMLYAWPVTAAMLIILILVKLLVFRLASRTFNEKGITISSVMFDIISPVINSLIYIAKFGNQAGKKAWR